MEANMTFTELLGDAQERRGFSQRRAAAWLDVTPITYRRWLSGELHPHWSNVDRLARFTGISEADMLTIIYKGVDQNASMGVYLSSDSRSAA